MAESDNPQPSPATDPEQSEAVKPHSHGIRKWVIANVAVILGVLAWLLAGSAKFVDISSRTDERLKNVESLRTEFGNLKEDYGELKGRCSEFYNDTEELIERNQFVVQTGKYAASEEIDRANREYVDEWKRLQRIPTTKEVDDGNSMRFGEFKVAFPKPFSKKPTVHIGLVGFDTDSVVNTLEPDQQEPTNPSRLIVVVEPEDIFKDHFIVKSIIWNRVRLNYFEIRWVAFAENDDY